MKIADKLGFAYNSRISWADSILHTGGVRAPEAMEAEAEDAIGGFLARVAEAGAAGQDVAFSDFLEPGNRWNPLIRKLVGQITSLEPEDCSTLDYARYRGEGGDFPVEAGFGALVARHAAGLDVTLATPVTAVDWSGPEVKLDTPRGTIAARAIILAVPVNVLLAGGIRFTPALPVRLTEALHDCPMGVSEKLAMLLDRPIEGFRHIYGDVIDASGARPPFNLHLNPFGRPLLVSHMAGAGGRAMERAGDAEVMAVAMEALVEAFGGGIRKRVIRTLRTHWASDPFTLGGYSHARPGRANSRFVFSEPVGGKIVLAGEHCSIPFYSTVHGAHLSGVEAAQKALALLSP